MFEFWYDYIKSKYGDDARLCYMDTDSFVMHIKTEDFYKDIAPDVDRWFDTSNYNKNSIDYFQVVRTKRSLVKSRMSWEVR